MRCPKCGEEFPGRTILGGMPSVRVRERYFLCEKCHTVTPEKVVLKQVKKEHSK